MKKTSSEIQVIGVSAGGIQDLPLSLQETITSGLKIAGSKRIIASLKHWFKIKSFEDPLPELYESDKTNELINWVKQLKENAIVLASGDPLWFGIGRNLLENFPDKNIIFHPSQTCLQLAFSRIGRSWQDASWISLHGRDSALLKEALQKHPKAIAILTDPNKGGIKEIRNFLRAMEIERNYHFWLFEQLGHPKERITKILPSELIPKNIDPLNLVVLIKQTKPIFLKSEIPLFGIEDDIFLQYADRPGLMTKREVRVQILSELELPKQGVLWDIGAGVGSIGLEALRIRPELKLLSIDKRVGSKNLIEKNSSRLSVCPCEVIESDILNALEKEKIPGYLSKPDRIILGGGSLYDKQMLIESILERISCKGIIVIPLATLQSFNIIEEILKKSDCSIKISQHQHSRGVQIAEGTRFSPMNPVFILKAKLEK
ncbi:MULTISPECIES: bifunctional cobalt-precorrin-7 (C(5))-methyltransferase/cobalt-precorrin-6B (C(15))-methyltransferase [Prochlorococcus]|uniref:bifunctional cobalt-precorrin-7 (C(5))-methyltransferase/cobalt-precorrin-6B (C(15))-methyltransferase n=1 Tax=Prochlorococcus TaxID=1218 RepID=UPI000533A0C2|nr:MULTISPECIES: bifunctional cobalt-precorrin-7 (C(5))-methyltransferase/cobalt-precorrin-6B (C(15))-methyltransferase [Prochlorococcus]KGG12023.1 Cobalt-precorrin-6y C5-methyltransferase [Prochlorococcus sp. MIT 0601]